MTKIKIEEVSKKFTNFEVLKDVDFQVEEGEFVSILGASGCGKSTLLNLIAGFDFPTEGQINIDDKPVKGPDKKNLTIFQNYGLFPWRSVLKNVEYGLEIQGYNRKKRLKTAEKYLKMVNLWQFKDSFPHELSGGMKQRVNIARALSVDPQIIFMDEPLGALDAITRIKMQEDITKIWEKNKKTILFVTHDIEEAVYLSDRIIIMYSSPGRIKRIVKPRLGRPRDRTGPDFLKIRNLVYKELELSQEKGELQYYI